MNDPFFADAAERVLELDRREPPQAELVQVTAKLHRFVTGLERMLERGNPDWDAVRDQLVTIAAISRRGARDLGIESAGDAFVKHCPW